MPFRLDVKKFFLTYPQCAATKEDLKEKLTTLTYGGHSITNWIICKETHADGSPHLHAVVELDTKFNCRDERYFDFLGFHPKIESVRALKSAVAYCKKEGDWIASDGFEGAGGGTLQERWFEAVNTATKEEFLEYIRGNFSKEWILWHDKIQHYADRYYATPEPLFTTPAHFEFDVPELLNQWIVNNVNYFFNTS